MYNEYTKLNDKIIATENKKICVFNDNLYTDEYIENENKLELTEEELNSKKEKLKNIKSSRGISRLEYCIIPLIFVEFFAFLLIMHYKFNVEYINGGLETAKYLLVCSLSVLGIENVMINAAYKKKKINLTKDIEDLEILKMRYSNKKYELEKEVYKEEIETKTISKKEVLNEIKEELETLRQIHEEEKPKQNAFGTR